MDLDERMRQALAYWGWPVIIRYLPSWADEVTALLIANQELRKQNADLVAHLDIPRPQNPTEEPNELPF